MKTDTTSFHDTIFMVSIEAEYDIPAFGPRDKDEAISRMEEAEKQFAVGRFTDGNDFFRNTRRKIGGYAAQGL